jgi:L-alanine-DL-glutamate epimerase-like enolase superfamily enzyme
MRKGVSMKITKVKIAECRIPLPRILRLGPVEIRTRDYVVICIETEDGFCGEAIGYPRGTPLFEAASTMARKLLGKNAGMRRELMLGLELANVPARAGLTRSLSLMDIALWDIACKRAQLPLYQFIGGCRNTADVTVVAGYYVDQRSIADVVNEVRALKDSGCRRVKIMLKGDDPTFDRNYASSVADAMPGGVAADAHWSWSTFTEARRVCRELDELGLSFLEDPFAASDIRLTHELRNDLVTPIAAGEDVFGPRVVSNLVSGIDILRVDATTVGGITGAIEAIHIAAAAGRTVFPHVFSPLHVHLACAFPHVEGVELITAESGADPLHRILRNVPEMNDGKMIPSEEPGIGIAVDWEAVEKLSRLHAVVEPDASTRA